MWPAPEQPRVKAPCVALQVPEEQDVPPSPGAPREPRLATLPCDLVARRVSKEVVGQGWGRDRGQGSLSMDIAASTVLSRSEPGAQRGW